MTNICLNSFHRSINLFIYCNLFYRCRLRINAEDLQKLIAEVELSSMTDTLTISFDV
jgi:hypothetical protein